MVVEGENQVGSCLSRLTFQRNHVHLRTMVKGLLLVQSPPDPGGLVSSQPPGLAGFYLPKWGQLVSLPCHQQRRRMSLYKDPPFEGG